LKKLRRKRTDTAVLTFQGLATAVFVLVILFTALHLGTTEKGLRKLVSNYVNSAEIDSTYFDNFTDRGFTEEQALEFLSGSAVKDVVSDVMTERMLALFKDTEEYQYTQDNCLDRITEGLTQYCKENDVDISESNISILSTYTMDISGITNMFIYNTPALYRTSIFENEENNVSDYDNLFEVLATLLSPLFVLSVFFMYIICLVIMCLISTKEESCDIINRCCNTIIYPSFLFLGIALGYVLGASNGDVTSNYVFSVILITSIIMLAIGLVICIILNKIENYCKKHDAGFENWLKRRKEGSNNGRA
jgi:hypothetical protein